MKYYIYIIISVILIFSTNILQSQSIETSVEKNMVLIEGGTFMMGQSDPDISCKTCSADEQPIHKVTVSSFYINKYEVTLKEWRELMGNIPNFEGGCELCPVEGISWQDIQMFINKLNEKTGKEFRLPTEAEWEFAARGGNKSQATIYSGSSNLSEIGWYGIKAEPKLHPVGQKKPNELGIYDMSGNVWEWCNDFYKTDYYSNSPVENPSGPISGRDKVLRGGSWYNQSFDCRITTRYRFFPSFRTNANGFRLALPYKK